MPPLSLGGHALCCRALEKDDVGTCGFYLTDFHWKP
jgi:hypothetical protein